MVADKWEKIGTLGLGMKDYHVNNCRVGQSAVDYCYNVFQKFLQNASPKFQNVTWRNVIAAMTDADFAVAAGELKSALPLWYAQK